jgi:UDP-N-acetylglucosamine 2-epimerase (non-hydrolysing)
LSYFIIVVINNNINTINKDELINTIINYDYNKIGQLGEIIIKLKMYLSNIKPDLVIVFGDVTSTLSASITCHILNIKLAHVESGLRSNDISMPEEVNRILTDHITDIFFITEPQGKSNLIKEGHTNNLHYVGNTMIDTQKEFLNIALNTNFHKSITNKVYILLTLHRPSNVDNLNRLRSIFNDLIKLSDRMTIIYPIHHRTKKNLIKLGIYQSLVNDNNFILIQPQGYLQFTCLMANAYYVITDSGGVQEETTGLNIPCFTLRPNTERPITLIDNGGTNTLIHNISDINYIPTHYRCNVWDGKASNRIKDILIDIYSK